MLKIWDDHNNQASLVSWLPVNLNTPELAILRKAEEIELKEYYTKWNYFFLFKKSHVHTKRKNFVY